MLLNISKIKTEESKFYKYSYNKKENTLMVYKTPESSFMHIEEYKQEILFWLKINKKYHPEKIIVDNSHTEFIITPQLQQWVNQTLLIPSYNFGLRKIAFIQSTNLFTNVSMRQAMEEAKVDIKFNFFNNINQAIQWLKLSENVKF